MGRRAITVGAVVANLLVILAGVAVATVRGPLRGVLHTESYGFCLNSGDDRDATRLMRREGFFQACVSHVGHTVEIHYTEPNGDWTVANQRLNQAARTMWLRWPTEPTKIVVQQEGGDADLYASFDHARLKALFGAR